MAERVAIDCKFYRNTGSIALPTMALIESVRDVSISQSWEKAEFKTRQRSFKRYRKTLFERAIEFQLEHNPDDATENGHWEAFQAASESQTSTVIVAALDGLYATSGSQGLHGAFQVEKFDIAQELEDAVLYDVSLSLALFSEDPEWLVIA